MSQPIFVVDAFTDRPFAGNPAAVCLLPAPAAEAWMRDVAREMNLAETAFLHRVGTDYALRWFTPTVEVDLCGHATLASAHVLWTEGHLAPGETARFHTRSGVLTAVPRAPGIELDFPRAAAEAVDPPADLLPGLGLGAARWVGRNRFDYLVEIGSESELRALAPNFHALRSLGVRGVIVTSLADPGRSYDFASRFFAPGAGIDEDPVTGSAHCALAPHWGEKLGRTAMTGYQASARGGTVHVTCRGDRVLLGGQAVTVLRATLL
ncbi:MAG TPA: PhzF family phenazine biosynthesis protein [Gemmatimonadales bacterium]|nr:PhzF family phenazine biosynthesis protein [Gemmatimonadales bacterium]